MNILKHPNDELREVSRPVAEARFGTDELKMLVEDLKVAMKGDDGIGIAAPQTGVKDRVIIVSMKGTGPTAFVNPVITKRSLRKIEFEEGCLSVPGVFGMVERHKKVTVEALSVDGDKMSLNLADTYAVVFQHEIDHLDGILFIDKVKRFTHGTNVQV